MNTTEITLKEETVKVIDEANVTTLSSKNASTVITHVESDQTIILGQNSTEISVADATNTIVAKQTEQTVRITNIGLVGGAIPVPGTTDHNELVNRDLGDQHPQSAITNLVVDQAAQDQALLDHISDVGNPHDVIAAQVSFDNTDTQFLAVEVQTALEEIDEVIQTGTLEYAAIADPLADPNNIWDAVDQMDWTGHAHAAPGQNYLEIKENHVVTFGNQTQTAYRWVGTKPIFVGPGQPVTESANYQPIGTGDHGILVNRDAADQHPQSAITGLVTGQATQDTNIGDNTDQINAHEARTNNPHSVTWQQTGGTDPAHTHSHGSITGQTANDHHNQVHALYGSDHSDVETTPTLKTRHILGWDDKFKPDYRAKFLAFVNGNTYYPQETVYQDGWLSVANKETTDYPTPVTSGDPFWVYSGSAPSVEISAKQIIFGNRYTFGIAGWFEGYRVFTVSGNSYTVYSVDDPLGTPIFTQQITFVANFDGWTSLTSPKILVNPGTVFDIVVLVNEPAPTPVTWTGDWNYIKPNNENIPAAGEAVHAGKALGIISFNKTDDNGGDRSAELLALSIGDVIQISVSGTRWTIQNIIDNGTYVNFGILPATQDTLTGIETFSFETVVVTPISQMEDVDWWLLNSPVNGSVQGLVIVDGVYENIVPNNSAYGVDILTQVATMSGDWDIYGSPSDGSSGGGGGDFTPTVFTGAGTSGYVPDPITETGKVLLDDGTWIVPPSGVTDHGALGGLGDDDHPQYHTDARGDVRYPLDAVYADARPDPTPYKQGQVWVRTSDMKRFELYIDVDSREWVQQGTSISGKDGADGAPGVDAPVLPTGFKNVLINGDFRVNQRGFDGDWSGVVNGEFGYDRWYFGGQTGYKYQKLEAANLIDGETYTLSWEGGGVGGFAHANGSAASPWGPSPCVGIMTPIVGSHTPLVQVPDDAVNVQLERGTEETNFEVRSIQQELAMCQRYYETGSFYNSLPFGNNTIIGSYHTDIQFKVTKRVTPVVTGVSHEGTFSANAVKVSGAGLGRSDTVANRNNSGTYIADAEI